MDGKAYCDGMLVRVACDGAHPFVAGMIVDPQTERVIATAPILRYLMGQHRDKLRQTFARLGWKATIVRPRASRPSPAPPPEPPASPCAAPSRTPDAP